jgi:NADH:ubiquinone oxidoreductase subunit D
VKRSALPVDNTLLISRFQQKELYQSAPSTSNVSPTMTQLASHALNPFFDRLAIKIGLELKLLGSRIINSQVSRGYFCHDLEQIIAENSFIEGINSIARINHRTPIFYQLALVSAYENLLDYDASLEIKQMRALALEVARIYHHFCVLKDIFMSLNADNLFDLARSGKNLIKSEALMLGTVNNNTPQNSLSTLATRDLLEISEAIIQIIDDMDISSEYETIQGQLRKKAIINLTLASSLGLSGAFIRANRNFYDLRGSANSSIDYGPLPKINIAEGGDALARLSLRIRDIQSSALWLKDTLNRFKTEGLEPKPLREEKEIILKNSSKKFAFGEIEGPEGDIKAALFVDEEQAITFHLRSPAYFIAQAIPHLLLYLDLNDLPVILTSLGISAEEIDK